MTYLEALVGTSALLVSVLAPNRVERPGGLQRHPSEARQQLDAANSRVSGSASEAPSALTVSSLSSHPPPSFVAWHCALNRHANRPLLQRRDARWTLGDWGWKSAAPLRNVASVSPQ